MSQQKEKLSFKHKNQVTLNRDDLDTYIMCIPNSQPFQKNTCLEIWNVVQHSLPNFTSKSTFCYFVAVLSSNFDLACYFA